MSGWSQEFRKGFFVGAGVIGALIVVGFVMKRV
jgi:hypothetical protein